MLSNIYKIINKENVQMCPSIKLQYLAKYKYLLLDIIWHQAFHILQHFSRVLNTINNLIYLTCIIWNW